MEDDVESLASDFSGADSGVSGFSEVIAFSQR